jgi:hypothetical protein
MGEGKRFLDEAAMKFIATIVAKRGLVMMREKAGDERAKGQRIAHEFGFSTDSIDLIEEGREFVVKMTSMVLFLGILLFAMV